MSPLPDQIHVALTREYQHQKNQCLELRQGEVKQIASGEKDREREHQNKAGQRSADQYQRANMPAVGLEEKDTRSVAIDIVTKSLVNNSSTISSGVITKVPVKIIPRLR